MLVCLHVCSLSISFWFIVTFGLSWLRASLAVSNIHLFFAASLPRAFAPSLGQSFIESSCQSFFEQSDQTWQYCCHSIHCKGTLLSPTPPPPTRYVRKSKVRSFACFALFGPPLSAESCWAGQLRRGGRWFWLKAKIAPADHHLDGILHNCSTISGQKYWAHNLKNKLASLEAMGKV